MRVGGASLAALLAIEAAAQPPLPVRAGTSVRPDTVTVGDPFVVQVRVSAPAGASVSFPTALDSGSAAALLDPPREARSAAPGGGMDVTATYRVAAWDVGPNLPLGFGDAVVRLGVAERRVPLGNLRVTVRSVLPADSTLRRPKPVREPLPDAGLWWLPWLAALLALAALVAGLVWAAARWWRRRRDQRPSDQAYRDAVAAFARLDRMQLVAAGEGGRHLALASDVARDYLAARLPRADRALTSGELVAALAAEPDVPHDQLAAVLADADFAKFANVVVLPNTAEEGGRAARALVDDVEAAVRARAAREAAEAAEAQRTAREAQRRYEEERRRAARRNGKGGEGSGGEPPRERAA